MRGIVIDPKLRRIQDVELRDDNVLPDIWKLIGSDNLDHMTLSDAGDTLWCYGFALMEGPVFAFRIVSRGQKTDPLGGICVITGYDRNSGESCDCHIPISLLENTVEFLDEIIPEVTMVTEESKPGFTHIRQVVTYSRVKNG